MISLVAEARLIGELLADIDYACAGLIRMQWRVTAEGMLTRWITGLIAHGDHRLALYGSLSCRCPPNIPAVNGVLLFTLGTKT